MSSILLASPEDLRDAIRDVTRSVLEEIVPELVREGTQKPYLSQDELRELTSWPNRKLKYLRDTRQIEFVALGRSYLYRTGSVLRFLSDHRVRVQRSKVPSWSSSSEITNEMKGQDLSR